MLVSSEMLFISEGKGILMVEQQERTRRGKPLSRPMRSITVITPESAGLLGSTYEGSCRVS